MNDRTDQPRPPRTAWRLAYGAEHLTRLRRRLTEDVEARRIDGRDDRFRLIYPDAKYASLEAFILAEGRSYTPAFRPKSVRRGVAGDCYGNAFLLATNRRCRLQRMVGQRPPFAYVEGYGAMGGQPILHAWCVTPDGVVVDPTWENTDFCAYIGIEIPWEALADNVLRVGFHGILANDQINAYRMRRTGQVWSPTWGQDDTEAR